MKNNTLANKSFNYIKSIGTRYRIHRCFSFLILTIFCWLNAFDNAIAAAASWGDISNTTVETISNLSSVMIAVTYAIGAGFGFATLIKFKAHRDNPQQVPISMVITLLCAALAFLGLGLLMNTIGASLFGLSPQ